MIKTVKFILATGNVNAQDIKFPDDVIAELNERASDGGIPVIGPTGDELGDVVDSELVGDECVVTIQTRQQV